MERALNSFFNFSFSEALELMAKTTPSVASAYEPKSTSRKKVVYLSTIPQIKVTSLNIPSATGPALQEIIDPYCPRP